MGKQFKRLLGNGVHCFAVASKAAFLQGLGLMLFFVGWVSTTQAAIPAAERAVLINLYIATNGASWTEQTNWNGEVGTECTWYRVGCDEMRSHVQTIDFGYTGNNLVGALPGLSALTDLRFFRVDNNRLTGSIPELSGLTSLGSFYGNNNQWTGSIPALNGLTALQVFSVNSNQLTGSIPALGGLIALSQFEASDNQLSGLVPSLSGLTTLTRFDVQNNRLTGSIPSLSGLTNLLQMFFANNQLSGPVPPAPISLYAKGSSLCFNYLVASGNPSIDAAWVTATGFDWLACQANYGTPICHMNSLPVRIGRGELLTLAAACSPAATSFVWTGGTCVGNTTNACVVTPSATTSYTVAGSNAVGVGNDFGTTVNVTGQPTPPTSVTATPASGSAVVFFTPGAIGDGMLVTYSAACSTSCAYFPAPPGTWNYCTRAQNGSSSPITVGGLRDGHSYRCGVIAVSTAGTSNSSAASNPVTPPTTGPVVEFYNTILDNYFVTADVNEASAIDKGSAGPGWMRTGNAFNSGGPTSVCRFYGSATPGPNSHFYTVIASECQKLKDAQFAANDPRRLTIKSWNFESLDFMSTAPIRPATGNLYCPDGLVPVFRAYNNGFGRGVDSNHRLTSNWSAIQQVVARGWISEDIVMCAPP